MRTDDAHSRHDRRCRWSLALQRVNFAQLGVTGALPTILAVLGPPANEAQRAEALAIPGLVFLETGLGLEWTAPDAASGEGIARSLAAIADDFHVDSVHLHAPALVGRAAWPAPVVAMVQFLPANMVARHAHTGPYPEAFACRIAATHAGFERGRPGGRTKQRFRSRRANCLWPRTCHQMRAQWKAAPCECRQWDRRAGVFASGRLWDEAKNFAGLDRAARHLSALVTVAGEKRSPEGGDINLQHIRHLGILGETGLAEQLAGKQRFCWAVIIRAIRTFRPGGGASWHGSGAF